MASLETRAGLKPSEKKLPYAITTAQVENYLQKKVDVLCSRDKSLPQNIDVRVYSTEASKSYLPFVVVLPTSVLVDKDKKQNKNPEVDSFFVTEGHAKKREDLLKPFKTLFSIYAYNGDDLKAFSSNDWRHARSVSRTTSEALKSMVFPKVSKYRGEGGRNTYVVMFLLDPLRVFHDMLKMEDDNREFTINIKDLIKMRAGEYRYVMERSIRNGKNKNSYGNQAIINELNRAMRGRR